MRFYAKRNDGSKVYLNLSRRIRNRRQIEQVIGSKNFFVGKERFNIDQVYAEDSLNDTVGGAIVGCVFGMLGGPTGAIVGTVLGTAFGNSKDREDKLRIEEFNNGIF